MKWPRLLMTEKRIRAILHKADKADPKGQFTAHYDTYLKYRLLASKGNITFDVHEIRFPWWRDKEVESGVHLLNSKYDRDMGNPLKPVGVATYDFYIKEGFKYAVVHSRGYQSFLVDNAIAKKFSSFSKFYRELFNKGKLIKTFSSNTSKKWRGPEVRIYEFTTASS